VIAEVYLRARERRVQIESFLDGLAEAIESRDL
jgi:hypothetical protein